MGIIAKVLGLFCGSMRLAVGPPVVAVVVVARWSGVDGAMSGRCWGR